jgi:hypothetical protein
MRALILFALLFTPLSLQAADLAPPDGAAFVFERTVTDPAGGEIVETVEYRIRRREGALGIELYAADELEAIYRTDMLQNTTQALFPDVEVHYRPYRPSYVDPVSSTSETVLRYQETDPDGANAGDCAALIRVGKQVETRFGLHVHSGVEMTRLLVCNHAPGEIRVEREEEIFCPEIKFSCVWRYADYLTQAPAPDFVSKQLTKPEDFDALEATLIASGPGYRMELQPLEVRLP